MKTVDLLKVKEIKSYCYNLLKWNLTYNTIFAYKRNFITKTMLSC